MMLAFLTYVIGIVVVIYTSIHCIKVFKEKNKVGGITIIVLILVALFCPYIILTV
ncbi:hypothetical protein [Bacillus sp. Marseille-P3661]|uniref:hypothetical protein n=1 Tax=Bacillus sp. Marseille-P3661 TaxID=1936234 RepID=UPI0015E1684D|nr:hypothetical protein [Bacillus sp. Marseille-P3661]